MADAEASPTADVGASGPKRPLALAMVTTATGFAFLLVQRDVSIANVALPTIGRDLGALGVALFGTLLAADAGGGLRMALLISAAMLAVAAVAVALAGGGRSAE